MTERIFHMFVADGASLSADKKRDANSIERKRKDVERQYSKQIAAAPFSFSKQVTRAEELAGLPEAFLDNAIARAQAADLEGYYIDLSDYHDVMCFCSNRDLREEMWKAQAAFDGICLPEDKTSNAPRVLKILGYRTEEASLFGYSSYADYRTRFSSFKDAAGTIQYLENQVQSLKKELDPYKKALGVA